MVSLPVVIDSHQTLQTEQLAFGPSFYRTSEYVHGQELSKASICKTKGNQITLGNHTGGLLENALNYHYIV